MDIRRFCYIGDLFVDDLYVTLDQLERVLGKPRGLLMFQYFALYNALAIAWRQPQEFVDFNPDVLVVEMFLLSQINSSEKNNWKKEEKLHAVLAFENENLKILILTMKFIWWPSQ